MSYPVQLKRAWANLTVSHDPIFIDPEFEQENFDFISEQEWSINPVFLDVGGHQGIWSTFLAQLGMGSTPRAIYFRPREDRRARYAVHVRVQSGHGEAD